MKSLEIKLRKGILWSVVQVFIRRVFDLFVKLILINILFPEDFGLVGIATATTGIVHVISEFGLKDALIQRRGELLEDLHYQSVFWWNIFWSILIYLSVFFLITPVVSTFYDEPLLIKIIPILAVPILLQATTLVYRIKVLRNLNFKIIAIFNSIATVIAGIIAIVIALKGGGVWSLVIYIYIDSLHRYISIFRAYGTLETKV